MLTAHARHSFPCTNPMPFGAAWNVQETRMTRGACIRFRVLSCARETQWLTWTLRRRVISQSAHRASSESPRGTPSEACGSRYFAFYACATFFFAQHFVHLHWTL